MLCLKCPTNSEWIEAAKNDLLSVIIDVHEVILNVSSSSIVVGDAGCVREK